MTSEKSTRILISGSTGMLGSYVVRCLRSSSHKFEVFTTSRKEINGVNHFAADLTNKTEISRILREVQPEVIVHCAAIVNILKCEEDKEYANLVHVEVTDTLANFPSVREFIYISTDSVFDGQKGNYHENYHVNPLNYYAQTKYEGELVALKSNKKCAVLRTNIIGFNDPPGSSLFEWAIRNLLDNRSITGYENVYFNPLYCDDLASVIHDLMRIDYEPGVYHVGAKGGISKYEFLKYVKSSIAVDIGNVMVGKLENIPPKIIRPLNTILNTDRIDKLGIILPSIKQTIDNLIIDYTSKST